jgi:hypothetical protein
MGTASRRIAVKRFCNAHHFRIGCILHPGVEVSTFVRVQNLKPDTGTGFGVDI